MEKKFNAYLNDELVGNQDTVKFDPDPFKGKKDESALTVSGGRGIGKVAVIGHIDNHTSSLSNQITKQLKELDVELVSLESDVKSLKDISEHYLQYEPLPELKMFGEEKKKKKSCTYHEYVLAEKIKEVFGGGTVVREIWKCRHCSHPLK
jgi:hypothetical protein